MKGRMIGLLAVAALVAASASQADDKEDRDRLQGPWKAVSYEAEGSTDVLILPETFTFEFKGNAFSFPWLDVKITGNFKIDSAKQPKVIDLSSEDAEIGKAVCGIYEWEGDTLKLCYGEERPKEFKTELDSKKWVLVLKREKKKEK